MTLLDSLCPIKSRDLLCYFYAGLRGHVPRGMLLHGRGLGEDRPQITGQVNPGLYDLPQYTMHLDYPIMEGNVYILKPGAMPADAPDSIRCGDTVVVSKNGARRLRKRPIEFPSLPT